MYNKRKFNKINDKKILHKVKKQWVTISLALFMMIGGGAVATHVSASADATNDQNQQPISVKLGSKNGNKNTITNKAKALHNHLMSNATKNVANNPRVHKQNKRVVNLSNNKKPSAKKIVNLSKNKQPARKINNVNQLKVNHNGLYKNHLYSQVTVPFNTLRINRKTLLHSNIESVGSKRHALGAFYRGNIVKVSRAFRGYYRNNSFLRYEVPLAHKRSAFITGNNRFVSYVAPTTNYRYYQRKINHILTHSNSKKFSNIRSLVNKLAKREVKNYRTYMGLYVEAYNTQQALKHPVTFNNKRKGYRANKHFNNGTTSQSNEVNSLENNANNNVSYVPSNSAESFASASMVAPSFIPASVTPVPAPFVPNYVPSASSSANGSVVAPSSASTTSNSSNTSMSSNASSNVVPSSMASNSSQSTSSMASNSGSASASLNASGSVVPSSSESNQSSTASSVNSKSASSAVSSKANQPSSSVVPSSTSAKSSSTNSSVNSNSSASSKASSSVMPSSSKTGQSSAASSVNSKSTSSAASSKASQSTGSRASSNVTPSSASTKPSSATSSAASKSASSVVNTPSENVSQVADTTLDDINKERVQNSVAPLSINTDLQSVASMRADQLIDDFNHHNSRGQLYADLDAEKVAPKLVGKIAENIATSTLGPSYEKGTNSKGQNDSTLYNNKNGADMANMMNDGMMNYDADQGNGHRYNILNDDYTTVGIGTSYDPKSGRYYLAEDFSSLSNSSSNNSNSSSAASHASASNSNTSKSSSTNSSRSNASKSNASSANSSSNVKLSSSASANNHKAQVTNGVYRGWNYSYNPTTKGLEFTGGTLKKNAANNFMNGSDTPSDIKNATTLKLDTTAGFGENNNLSKLFANDSNLVSVNISNTNLNHKVVNGMFAHDSKLSNLNLSNVQSGYIYLADLDGIFLNGISDCSLIWGDENLNKVNVNGFVGCKTMSDMFAGSGLKSINSNTFNLKGINFNNTLFAGNLFADSPNLESVDISGVNLSHVISVNNMFAHDPKLNDLNLSNVQSGNINQSDVAGIDLNGLSDCSLVYGDSNLSKVNVNGFIGNTNMSNMFAGSGLRRISHNNFDLRHVNFSKTKYAGNLFANDNNLVSVDVSGTNFSNLIVNRMFANNPNLTALNLSDVKSGNINQADLATIDLNGSSDCSLIWGDNNLSKINVNGFIGNTNMSNMFAGSGLKYINHNNFDLRHVNFNKTRSVANLFGDDPKLINANISGTNLSNLFVNKMFADNPNLVTLNLSNVKSGNINQSDILGINLNQVYDCSLVNGDTHLTNVYVNGFIGNTNMSGMFAESGLKSINSDNFDVKAIDFSKTRYASDLFADSPKLVTANISNTIMDNVDDINDIFSNDPNLITLNMSHVNAGNTNAGSNNSLISGDKNIKNINFNEFKYWYGPVTVSNTNSSNQKQITNKFNTELTNTINNMVNNKSKSTNTNTINDVTSKSQSINNNSTMNFIFNTLKHIGEIMSYADEGPLSLFAHLQTIGGIYNSDTQPYGNMSSVYNAMSLDSDCGNEYRIAIPKGFPDSDINCIQLKHDPKFNLVIPKQAVEQLIDLVTSISKVDSGDLPQLIISKASDEMKTYGIAQVDDFYTQIVHSNKKVVDNITITASDIHTVSNDHDNIEKAENELNKARVDDPNNVSEAANNLDSSISTAEHDDINIAVQFLPDYFLFKINSIL